MMKLIVIMLLILVQMGCSKSPAPTQQQSPPHQETKLDVKVIYGEDNRMDLYQVPDSKLHQLSRSTAALVSSNKLVLNQNNEYELNAGVYGERYALCSDERFFSQPNGSFCSGFLVQEDIMITAGHCIRHQSECDSTKFLFDYGYYQADASLERFQKEQVYSCKEIIKSYQRAGDADYAVIRLDRPVTSRTPLILSEENELKTGDDIFVIGHPAGLPTKFAPGAQVRRFESNYFVADLDTYGGNSGSAVFNSKTNKVEGILVRGEMDFIFDRAGCRRSKRCNQGECAGEDVTDIQIVKTHIPDKQIKIPEPEKYIFNESFLIEDFQSYDATVTVNNSPSEAKKLYVKVDIDHTYIGDLSLILKTPSGEKIKLHNKNGYAADFIKGVYGRSLIPIEPLNIPPQSGLWSLEVKDHNSGDSGRLNSWTLIFE